MLRGNTNDGDLMLLAPGAQKIHSLPPRLGLLIAAQFFSALADNALLIVTMALLIEQGFPPWWAPLLKLGFTLSYVLLAPFVGPLADAVPKARLMAWMNGLKAVGVVGLLAGWHPALAFAVVGLGAAIYAPAKYGLVTEWVRPAQLVAANAWLEVSVVAAALLGAVLGGLLVSPWWFTQLEFFSPLTGLLESALTGSLFALLLVYALAGVLNLGVPDSGATYAPSSRQPLTLVREFWQSNRTLWADRDGGLSLAVTTLFWGLGATLQFAVLRWAADVLQLPLDQAAYLQAAVAVGVVVGAGAAGRWVPLHQARRLLWLGVVLGGLIALVASSRSLTVALPLLVAIGVTGGLLVVPLNALLQHRGYTLLTAGRSIAVQGFNENASVLFMLTLYALMLGSDMPVATFITFFGLAIALAMALLMLRERLRAQRVGVLLSTPPA
jgi:MFS transporter, LPLT family, lysophospholipid transporter